MMKGMFKRALAGVAAAALAVTGLALAAGAANAAEPPMSGSTTFTFTAETEEQLLNARLRAYKLADYVQYGIGSNVVYGVQTNEKNKTAVEKALKNAGVVVDSGADAMAYAMQKGLLDQSTVRPWEDKDDAGTASTSRKFATELGKLLDGMTAVNADPADPYTFTEDAIQGSGQYSVSVTLKEPGVYLFIDEATAGDYPQDDGSKVNVTTAIPMIVASGKAENGVLNPLATDPGLNTVNMKNSAITSLDKQVETDEEGLHFKVTGEVPNQSGVTFSITDVPSLGLTVQFDTLKVTAGGDKLETDDYTVTKYEKGAMDGTAVAEGDTLDGTWNGQGTPDAKTTTEARFVVALNKADEYRGKKIVVTYDATTNADVPENVVNWAGNDYGSSDSTTTTLHNLTIEKHNADNQQLNGAVFNVAAGDVSAIKAEERTSLVFKDKQLVPAGTKGASADVTVNGTATLTRLPQGTYTVWETTAPSGYMNGVALPTFVITIDANGTVTVKTNDRDLATVNGSTLSVLNVRNVSQLPQTGAAGIAMFVMLGLLIAGAGALVYMKSRNVKHALRG